MRSLSTVEVTRLVDTAESSFNDTCTIIATTVTGQDSFGAPSHSYATSTGVACGFSLMPGRYEYKNERGQVVTLDCDAILRLSLTEDVSVLDFVICHGKRFTIDGVIDGRTVQIVALKELATDDNPSSVDDNPS